MDLIVTDTNGTPSGSYASWTLDLAYGLHSSVGRARGC